MDHYGNCHSGIDFPDAEIERGESGKEAVVSGSMYRKILWIFRRAARRGRKAVDAVARQPEADSKISKNLLLGCALAEATAIYGMVVAILIIFLCK